MEVQLNPDQRAHLAELANRAGKTEEQIVEEAVARMLDEDARFVEAVEKGFAPLDRGEYVEHEEVKARIDRLLKS